MTDLNVTIPQYYAQQNETANCHNKIKNQAIQYQSSANPRACKALSSYFGSSNNIQKPLSLMNKQMEISYGVTPLKVKEGIAFFENNENHKAINCFTCSLNGSNEFWQAKSQYYLGRAYSTSNPEQAIQYIEKSNHNLNQIYTKTGSTHILADIAYALLHLAGLYNKTSLDEGIVNQTLDKAESIFTQLDEQCGQSFTIKSRSFLSHDRNKHRELVKASQSGNYKKAIEEGEMLRRSTNTKQDETYYANLQNLGTSYSKIGMYSKGQQLIKSAIEGLERRRLNKEGLTFCLDLNQAYSYRLHLANSLWKSGDFISALKSAEAGEKYFSKYPTNENANKMLALFQNCQASIHLECGNLEEAYKIATQAKKNFSSMSSIDCEKKHIACLILMGCIANKKGSFKKGTAHINNAITLINKPTNTAKKEIKEKYEKQMIALDSNNLAFDLELKKETIKKQRDVDLSLIKPDETYRLMLVKCLINKADMLSKQSTSEESTTAAIQYLSNALSELGYPEEEINDNLSASTKKSIHREKILDCLHIKAVIHTNAENYALAIENNKMAYCGFKEISLENTAPALINSNTEGKKSSMDESINRIKTHRANKKSALCLLSLGISYSKSNNKEHNDLAIKTLENALKENSNIAHNRESILNNQRRLGIAYCNFGNNEDEKQKGIELLQKTLEEYKLEDNNLLYKLKTLYCCFSLGKAYTQLDEAKLAKDYLEQAYKGFKSLSNELAQNKVALCLHELNLKTIDD